MYHDVKIDDLNGEMRDIAEMIGIETLIDLCELFGGDNVYIPLDTDESLEFEGDIKELADAVGKDKYKKLKMYYSGTNIYFKKTENLLKTYIERKVKSEYDGNNRRRIMQKYRLSKVRFYSIINNVEEKNKQIQGQLTLDM